jgi:membrane fusion protein (multidrug efflux system)
VKKLFIIILISLPLLQCFQNNSEDELDIALPVSIMEIKPGYIEEFITSTATVSAIKSVQLRNEVEGVYSIATNPQTGKSFAIGDKVVENQAIIVLKNPEYENNIKIESQKLNLDISQREYEKQKSLYDKGGVTLRELINAERTFVEAKYAYENAQINLAKLKVKAPFSGIIVDLPFYTGGSRIDINQTVAELMDYDELYTEIFFPAKDLGRVKEQQPVRVMHYNFPDDTLHGFIQHVAPAINSESRSFKATVLIDNPNLLIRPGMFVQIETIVASRDSAIVIPKDIILSKRRGKTVFTVEKGAAFERVITTGLENNREVEVLDGLSADQRIVTKGFETLRDHSKIKIVR